MSYFAISSQIKLLNCSHLRSSKLFYLHVISTPFMFHTNQLLLGRLSSIEFCFVNNTKQVVNHILDLLQKNTFDRPAGIAQHFSHKS